MTEEMQKRTLRVLEFTRIREILSEYAVTDMGRELCLQAQVYADLPQVQALQEETEEASVVIAYTGGSPLTSFGDVRQNLKLAMKGATLSPRALLDIAGMLRASRGARDALVTERENTPRLRSMAESLRPLERVERDIQDAILSEDEISDHASPALADIRRHLRGATDRIRDKLNQMLRNPSFQKFVQDPIITVRNGRYVIPVRADARGSVPGLVHDQSASGATLFIEPMAAVEMGNELKQWEAKERLEIERILAALSAEVAPEAENLVQDVDTLAELDFIFARGLLGRHMHAVTPRLNAEGYLSIVRGRHPLIDPEKVVPSSLWLGRDFTELIITGPNTGGKTVTLKTVGLFTLMTQAGLQVPADIGTEMSVFEQVFADIGDEQSIEQSLSTFSGHMTNIVEIMRDVTPRDLVLFDELGAGTDPTEGAALAQSILSRLLEIHVRTMATTHYAELKAYALSTKGVENASVEFDVETLRPTYRLSLGIPGKSNAFEISRRLGLPEQLIESARSLLSTDTVRFEDVIANAEYHRQVAERERQIAEEASRETVRLRDEAERLRKEMENRRESTLRKTREDARRIMENARRESENIIADLKKMRRQASQAQDTDVNALRRRMDAGIDELSDHLKEQESGDGEAPKTVEAGQTVRVLSLGTDAVVLSSPDSRGEVQVQAGAMKFKVPLAQLRLRKAPKAAPVVKVSSQTDTLNRSVRMECDVRGMTAEEAILTVDQYIDGMVMSGVGEVSIIHGKGTGALRSAIQGELRHHPHVKKIRLGVYGEGEDGVTIVTLK